MRDSNFGARLQTTYSRYPQSGAQYGITVQSETGASASQYFDALGRLITTRQTGFDGQDIVSEIEYDNLSRVKRQSLPHYSSDGAHWSTNTYDDFRLLNQQVPASGGAFAPTNLAYSVDTSTGTHLYAITRQNALLQNRTELSNPAGELVQVTDNLGGIVKYLYNADGQLAQTVNLGTQNGTSVTINTYFSYDALGRRVKSRDSDKGIWYYQYNAFDDLTDQYKVMLDSGNTALNGTFAQALANSAVKMQRTHVDYDRRGRMIAQADYRENGALEGSASWSYDTAANGIGELASETGGGLTRNYSYQAYGTTNFTVSAMHQDGNGSYLLSATFDSFGRVNKTTDALGSGSGLLQTYNAYGYALAVSDLASGTIISQVQSMDALGNVTGAQLGNGATSTVEFDQGSGLPLQQSAVLGTMKLQDLSYTWDVLGNQTSRRDRGVLSQLNNTYKDLKQYFCYDGLNRLTRTYNGALAGSCAGVSQQDQQYDSFGNITSKTGIGNYSYSAAHPHQLTTTGDGVSYTYDTVGNLISDTSPRTLHYTVFDKPDVITKASYQISFSYGPDRDYYKRVDNNNSAVTTTYKIGNVEKVVKPDGSYDMKRYLAGVAIWNHHFNSSGTQTSVDKNYLYTDVLGSLVLITDAIGTVQRQYAYDAWGRRVDSADWSTALSTTPFLPVSQQPTTQGFTGQDMLDAVGLIHYGGRIYDQKIARFVQADPGVPYPLNLQSHNRYSYVRNNPLGRVDPTGYSDLYMVPAENLETIVPGPEGVTVIGYVGPDTLMTIANSGPGTSNSTETRYNTGTLSSNSSGTTLTNTSVGPNTAVNTTPNTSFSRSGGAGSGSVGGAGNGSRPPGASPAPGLTKPGLALGTGGPSGVNGNAFGQGGPSIWWSNTSSGGFNSNLISSNFASAAGEFVLGLIPFYDLYKAANNPNATALDYGLGFLGVIPPVKLTAGVPLKLGGLLGREIAWSNKSVRDAAKLLEKGTKEVSVSSRSEAEELLLGRYQAQGYRNSTGMSPVETKSFFGGKSGTYHWDEGANNFPHGSDHLQIHTFEGDVLRIYFP